MERPIIHTGAWNLHGCLDGFVITFEGREVQTFATFDAAALGLRHARRAQRQLGEILNQPKHKAA